MSDIIQLLPEAIANQIAAGEVVQRPASVVKELLENAVDAGADDIQLIVKEAGRSLIQVIDNGCGMSETDARLSFERHATSKIRKSEDLFAIRTKGFRGEALASIAAVAQVEMKTRQHHQELGTRILISGSKVEKQENCSCPAGTGIAVKNLFFNVPARRNFLKSNPVEMRHIIEEFQRIVLAHPDISFSLVHNGQYIHQLPAGNLRKRIVNLFGPQTNKKLIPLQDLNTDVIQIKGFIGKPEMARKTRGEQFFFVNKRFIKSGYLHHAVMSAYENMLSPNTHPLYILFLEIDPARIDVNIHPTKQEIKFEDERLIYKYLSVAVRHALGSIAQTIDFDQEMGLLRATQMTHTPGKAKPITPSASSNPTGPSPSSPLSPRPAQQDEWRKLYEGMQTPAENMPPPQQEEGEDDGLIMLESKLSGSTENEHEGKVASTAGKQPCQIHDRYILSSIKSGFMLIDQQAAHQRILYENYLEKLDTAKQSTQKELFPRTLECHAADAELITEIMPQLNKLGFEIEVFGKNTFIIHGIPAEMAANNQDPVAILESLLENYKHQAGLKLPLKENLARSLAQSAAIKPGQTLNPTEMQLLIDRLFACRDPYNSPSGGRCFITFSMEELARLFK
ncbi:MAG TPA: DNA mismatch repair endonuclease MutL [Phaeodactylibacter sp.]|nr:DNA mismatch repair endonuclease MutL [Phaeodactylibacter sp.]